MSETCFSKQLAQSCKQLQHAYVTAFVSACAHTTVQTYTVTPFDTFCAAVGCYPVCVTCHRTEERTTKYTTPTVTAQKNDIKPKATKYAAHLPVYLLVDVLQVCPAPAARLRLEPLQAKP